MTIYLNWFLQLLGVLFCLGLFVQDLRRREISLYLTLMLAGTGLVQQWLSRESLFWLSPLSNLCLCAVIFGLLWLIMSLRSSGPIMDRQIGWGDVVTLMAIACWPSPSEFLLFFSLSTGGLALCCLMLISAGKLPKDYPIPLAGWWALVLALQLGGDLFFQSILS